MATRPSRRRLNKRRRKGFGAAYRVIDDEYRTDPFSGLGSALKGGRYNAPHSFEALYSSDSRLTALHKVAAIFGDIDQPRSPELILTLDVRVTRVLDLTDRGLSEALGTTKEELTDSNSPAAFAAATTTPKVLLAEMFCSCASSP